MRRGGDTSLALPLKPVGNFHACPPLLRWAPGKASHWSCSQIQFALHQEWCLGKTIPFHHGEVQSGVPNLCKSTCSLENDVILCKVW